MTSATVALATMGSWGDIFPVIGLAKGMAEAGVDVRVAASPAYDELVTGEGLNFSGIGPPLGFSDYASDPKILSGRLGGFVGFAHLFRHFIFPALDRYVDDLADAIRGADLVLAHPALVAAPVAAEWVGVPWATISVFPGLIPTAYAPPAPTRVELGSGSIGRASHRAAWSVARLNMSRLFDGPVNRSRRRLGLAAVSDCFFGPVESGRPYIVMASPAVIDRPVDWPSNVTLTGFVTWDRVSSFPDPPGLEEFVSSGDPPVLVTLGASSSLDPQHFYRDAVEAVTGLGHRALVLTGPTPSPVELPDDPRVFSAPFARCPTSPRDHWPRSTTVASGPPSNYSAPGYRNSWFLAPSTSHRPRSACGASAWPGRSRGPAPPPNGSRVSSAHCSATATTATRPSPSRTASPEKTVSGTRSPPSTRPCELSPHTEPPDPRGDRRRPDQPDRRRTSALPDRRHLRCLVLGTLNGVDRLHRLRELDRLVVHQRARVE